MRKLNIKNVILFFESESINYTNKPKKFNQINARYESFTYKLLNFFYNNYTFTGKGLIENKSINPYFSNKIYLRKELYDVKNITIKRLYPKYIVKLYREGIIDFSIKEYGIIYDFLIKKEDKIYNCLSENAKKLFDLIIEELFEESLYSNIINSFFTKKTSTIIINDTDIVIKYVNIFWEKLIKETNLDNIIYISKNSFFLFNDDNSILKYIKNLKFDITIEDDINMFLYSDFGYVIENKTGIKTIGKTNSENIDIINNYIYKLKSIKRRFKINNILNNINNKK